MKETIVKALDRIEKDHNVKIILACESGSRAWGFPSIDSDYDVRFIFGNKKDWYLSIVDKRDVTELPPMHIDNLLAEVTDDLHFKDLVIQLITQKKGQTEAFTVERSENIEKYLTKKIIKEWGVPYG